MTAYRYRAMNSSGTIVTGVQEASSDAALVQSLRRDGCFTISVVDPAARSSFSAFRNIVLRDRISRRVLQKVTEELSTLMDAGLEIDRALSVIKRLAESDTDRGLFNRVQNRLRGGSSLSNSLAQETEIPRFYIAMIQAGEAGGTLPDTLKRLSAYLARDLELRGTIISALIYPAILLVSALTAIVIILTFVLPEFEPLFAAAGKSLPLPTRIVMGIAAAISGYWWVAALVVMAGYWWTKRKLSNFQTRRQFDAQLLQIPLVGRLFKAVQAERFFRTLGILLQNGIPLPNGLLIAGNVLGNSAIAFQVKGAAEGVREGHGFAEQLASSTLFPRSSFDLISIGENTGRLDQMLVRQADAEEARVRRLIDRLLAMFVPALTITLGLLIAGLIASMLVAILSVNDLAMQ